MTLSSLVLTQYIHKSDSAFPFTLYDMGKNKQNVDNLIMHAKAILK